MSAKQKPTELTLSLLYGMAIFVVLLWAGWWIFLAFTMDTPKAGQTGDLFGGINALFSGLAFAALIFTVHMQRQELALQRQELADTREVLGGQRTQMELQNKTLTKQSLESTFFQWLSLHHEIVRSVRSGAHEGRVAFEEIHRQLRSTYFHNIREQFGELLKGMNVNESYREMSAKFSQEVGFDRDAVEFAYGQAYKSAEDQLAHYFRNLYNLIKFIARSDLTERQKRFYTNIIRAQLSSAELALLFYNGLSVWGVCGILCKRVFV